MNIRQIAASMLVATSLASVSSGSAVAQGALLEFNYGYTTADHVTLYVAQDLNLFEKAGLKPNFFTFPSGAHVPDAAPIFVALPMS